MDDSTKMTFRDSPNIGFPIENKTFMYVQQDALENMGWKASLIDAGKPNLYMRMRSVSAMSNWYKIAGFSLISSTYYRVDIYKDIFGPDMNITTTDPNNVVFNTIIAGISMEIKQNVCLLYTSPSPRD